jgi:transcriptional regulator with XRE-family HTH domain
VETAAAVSSAPTRHGVPVWQSPEGKDVLRERRDGWTRECQNSVDDALDALVPHECGPRHERDSTGVADTRPRGPVAAMATTRAQVAASRLRQVRLHRNWTLRDLIAAVDEGAGRATGLTESLASSWELGKVRPSMFYRRLLCDVYGATPDELGFQEIVDPSDNVGGHELRLVTGHEELLAAMLGVVRGAEEYLAATGSRSREGIYLSEIERVLAEREKLVHYRILFGPPRRQAVKDHLLRLLEIRSPDDRAAAGVKRLFVGVVDDVVHEPERGIVASEKCAVLSIPSLVTAGNFDTGVVFCSPHEAQGFVQHVKQVYAGTRRVETFQAVEQLTVDG